MDSWNIKKTVIDVNLAVIQMMAKGIYISKKELDELDTSTSSYFQTILEKGKGKTVYNEIIERRQSNTNHEEAVLMFDNAMRQLAEFNIRDITWEDECWERDLPTFPVIMDNEKAGSILLLYRIGMLLDEFGGSGEQSSLQEYMDNTPKTIQSYINNNKKTIRVYNDAPHAIKKLELELKKI